MCARSAKDPSIEKMNAEKKHRRTEGVVLIALLGMMFSSVVTVAAFLYRLEKSEEVPASWAKWVDDLVPTVTYFECIAMVALSIGLLVMFCWHMTLQLRLAVLNMPVVPTPIPFFGQAFQFMAHNPWDSMLRWHQQYGPIIAFTMMGRTMVSLGRADHLKLALQSRIKSVKKDVAFTYKPFLVILGGGIVTSEDAKWMKQRVKISTPLKMTLLSRIPRITLEAVQRLMQTLDKAVETGKSIDLTEKFRYLTLQVISKTFLSLTADESDSTFGKMYLPIVDECNARVWHPYRAAAVFLPFWWKHMKTVSSLNAYVTNLIQKRWLKRRSKTTNVDNEEDDLLDMVLAAYEKEVRKDREGDLPVSLNKRMIMQIRDEFKTFMLAGHETSASMMTWAMYELIASPNLMDKMKEEGQRIFGKDADWINESSRNLPSQEKLGELQFSEACLKESLRKYSVVPVVIRKVVSDLNLGDYLIPKGSTLTINIHAVHQNPEYWPDPMNFSPSRFLEESPKPFTFVPFLEGPRNCLGQYLALLESKMVISLLCHRYEFIPVENPVPMNLNEKGQDPRHKYMIPITPNKEFNVKIRKRL